MPIFNTPRADRREDGYMEKLITTVYENSVYKEGFGVCDLSPDIIIATFRYIKRVFGKINPLEVHQIEVCVELEFGDEVALEIARYMGIYLYNQGFANFVSIIKLENYYLIKVIINAVSQLNGSMFQDNNRHYLQIYSALKTMLPAEWKLKAMDSVFFDTNNLANSYVHGKLV